MKVDKIDGVTTKERAQGFDPYILDSCDTVTPQGRQGFPEQTVPITINVGEGRDCVRETFLWNLDDQSLDPEAAAGV